MFGFLGCRFRSAHGTATGGSVDVVAGPTEAAEPVPPSAAAWLAVADGTLVPAPALPSTTAAAAGDGGWTALALVPSVVGTTTGMFPAPPTLLARALPVGPCGFTASGCTDADVSVQPWGCHRAI